MSSSLGMALVQWPSSYKCPSRAGDWISGIAHGIPSFSWNAWNWCSSQSWFFFWGGLVPLAGNLFQVCSPGFTPCHDSDVSSEGTSSAVPSLAAPWGNLVTERLSSALFIAVFPAPRTVLADSRGLINTCWIYEIKQPLHKALGCKRSAILCWARKKLRNEQRKEESTREERDRAPWGAEDKPG